ncbi:MAG: DUF6065 family protein [Methyloceanibacter sp.]
MAKKLTAYRIHEHERQRIVPGRQRRAWMDETNNRFAYRCLPLTIANAIGWEILLPAKVLAEWNGGNRLSDITIATDDPVLRPEHLAMSHFGHGILTFPIGYLFRTDPGVAIWARGAPNFFKDGIVPLDGVIETDWLCFTFTMNWQFTRPGLAVFEKDEPFCFITLVEYHGLDDVTPEIVPLEEAPEVAAQFAAFSQARKNFLSDLADKDPETVKQGWQKWYMRGESPFGTGRNPTHTSKLSLSEPVERQGACPRPRSKRPEEAGSD